MERLADGQSVLVFPEGTRSPEQGLHELQRGAFEIARRTGVPVVPILITAAPPWLMKHQPWWAVPRTMNRTRLRPLPDAPVEVPSESSKVVARRFHELYSRALQGNRAHPPGTA
jgi:1-acyl-sn-glycerol-3-phosphate acyltransferase